MRMKQLHPRSGERGDNHSSHGHADNCNLQSGVDSHGTAVAVGTMETAIMETAAMKFSTVKTAAMEPIRAHCSGKQHRN
jgi:hypothetical protein